MRNQSNIWHDACKLQIGQTLSKLLRRALLDEGCLVCLYGLDEVVWHQAIEAWLKSCTCRRDRVH